ncbi:hypothetical protein [Calothrix sp. PCC 6303]|uniref:hypothetical protein n=2 Tax=Calothrix sp. PCC 6303 TaxID=1170562 RepID=UPI00030ECA12|nr:hypothetical protein [Calothrix sp. PCC 6303]
MNGYSVISLDYNFDYGQFHKPELQGKAKNTLVEFFSFVRSTFDSLIETGRILQDLYYDCLAFCPKGKKVFEEWLKSDDFGASRYIAKSAMEIYLWFNKLAPKVQNLLRQNVQNWSVSALRQLTKVSTDLVKELVAGGKKTALEVKEEGEKDREKEGESVVEKSSQSCFNEKESSETSNSFTSPLLKAELAPGIRIIVTGDNYGWNGHKGIVLSQNGESWWVLLDHVVAQGSTTKSLYKSNQIEIEGIVENPDTKDVFTAVQVEKKIKEILAQRDTEKESSLEQERIAALKEIELQSAAALEKTKREKEELAQKLLDKERELEKVRSLTIKNQQLEQRISDLENTGNNGISNILNYSELEERIAPLTSEIERLNSINSSQEKEVAQLKSINSKQREKIQLLSQKDVYDKEEEIIAKFGELGEQSGWGGWSRRGYRNTSGILHTGINAIAAFVADLSKEHNYQTSL